MGETDKSFEIEADAIIAQTLKDNTDRLHDIIRALAIKLRIANRALSLHTVKPCERGRIGWRCHLCGREAPRSADIEHAENCPLKGYDGK